MFDVSFRELKLLLSVLGLLIIPTWLVSGNPLFGSGVFRLSSNYGIFVVVFLSIGVMWRIVSLIRVEDVHLKVVNVLGFEKSFKQIIIGFSSGVLVGAFTVWLNSEFFSVFSFSSSKLVSMLFVAPLFEETLFRGYLVNEVLEIGDGVRFKILAVFSSVFIFAWVHSESPELKVFGGLLYTTLYLWNWDNNLTAAIMAHLGANSAILFTAFTTLNPELALPTIIFTFTVLVLLALIIWNVEKISKQVFRFYRALLKERSEDSSQNDPSLETS